MKGKEHKLRTRWVSMLTRTATS